MTKTTSSPILHFIRRTLIDPGMKIAPDRVLLRRFLSERNEAAFEAILRRHGPMVLDVCRGVLANDADAEDALQATFLVLARKAGSIRKTATLACWLHGVAYRTALKARAESIQRRKHESRVPAREASDADSLTWAEVRGILHEQLSQLSERHREALVLCYLQGKTQDQAAALLGLSKGTLKRRLERGRALLRERLVRRGLGPAGVLVAAMWPSTSASACLPSTLVSSTVKAAGLSAAGQVAAADVISAKVAALTEGVVKAMLLTKLKVATVVLFAVSVVVAGGAALTLPVLGAGQRTAESATTQKPASKDADRAATDGLTPAQLSAAEPASGGDKPAWRELLTMKHEHAITAIAGSADWSVAGDEEGKLFAWDTKTGKNRRPLEGGWRIIDRLQFTADEKDQFTADGKSLHVIWGGRMGIARYFAKDKKFQGGHGFGGGDIDGVNMGYLGVSADAEICLELFRKGEGVNLRRNAYEFKMGKFDVRPNYDPNHFETVEYKAKVSHALVSADDKWLAVATKDGTLHIHDRTSLMRAGAESHPPEKHTIAAGKQGVVITDVQFSTDGQRIAVARDDALAKVYDTAKGEEVATLKGHSGIVFAVAFSPDGKKVVTGGDDNTARVWDAATGKALATLKGHTDSVRCVTFDPSGEILITGSADKTVKLWTGN